MLAAPLVFSLLALAALVARTWLRSALDLWLAVAMGAWTVEVVLAYDGIIAVTSTKKNGTTFTATIPRYADATKRWSAGQPRARLHLITPRSPG